MKTRHTLSLICYLILLSIVSIWITFQGANDEPYTTLRPTDALLQVGIGVALIVLWIQYAIFILYSVFKKKVSGWWLSSLIWTSIVIFYLHFSPVGYLSDISQFVFHDQKAAEQGVAANP